MPSNSTETRQIRGYERRWSDMGRTRIAVECAFCGAEIIAYVWSLAGSGKKCQCGAKLYSDGSMVKDMTDAGT